jgi:hypothetical protein
MGRIPIGLDRALVLGRCILHVSHPSFSWVRFGLAWKERPSRADDPYARGNASLASAFASSGISMRSEKRLGARFAITTCALTLRSVAKGLAVRLAEGFTGKLTARRELEIPRKHSRGAMGPTAPAGYLRKPQEHLSTGGWSCLAPCIGELRRPGKPNQHCAGRSMGLDRVSHEPNTGAPSGCAPSRRTAAETAKGAKPAKA